MFSTIEFYLSGLVLINLQPSSFLITFCLFISWSIFLWLCPNSSTLLQTCNRKSKDQLCNLKRCIQFAYLLLQMHILCLSTLFVV